MIHRAAKMNEPFATLVRVYSCNGVKSSSQEAVFIKFVTEATKMSDPMRSVCADFRARSRKLRRMKNGLFPQFSRPTTHCYGHRELLPVIISTPTTCASLPLTLMFNTCCDLLRPRENCFLSHLESRMPALVNVTEVLEMECLCRVVVVLEGRQSHVLFHIIKELNQCPDTLPFS